jgi:hypothetical protein
MARPEVVVSAVMSAIFAIMVVVALGYSAEARLVPLVIGVPGVMLAAWQLGADIVTPTPGQPSKREFTPMAGVGWLLLFLLLVLAGGFVIGGTLAVVVAQRYWQRESWRVAIVGGLLSWFVTAVCFDRLLGLVLFEGWLAAAWR